MALYGQKLPKGSGNTRKLGLRLTSVEQGERTMGPRAVVLSSLATHWSHLGDFKNITMPECGAQEFFCHWSGIQMAERDF